MEKILFGITGLTLGGAERVLVYIANNLYNKYEIIIFTIYAKGELEKQLKPQVKLKSFEKTYNDIKMSKKDKCVIYNYIDSAEVQRKSEKGQAKELEKEKINFVEVARLVPQKAIDIIIKVHSRLIKECGKKQNFYIIGDGPEKEKLQKLIKEYNVEDTFFLLGKKENPYPYIKNADYFCLLSEFEGYGMVLEEAKILNKPIIITNTAAREAVKNYSKSLIVENNEQ